MDMTEIERFDQQQVGKLKLSAAIRIGARIRPQCRHVFWTEGKSCAMGAALEAVGVEYGKAQNYGDLIQHYFPGIIGVVGGDIMKKNDAGESRESIADWLEAQGL